MNSSLYHVARRSFQPLFLLLTVFCVSIAGAATYTFDNLNTGTLAGQDNWRTINANNSSYVVKIGTGFDTTKIAGNPGTDNGSGFDVHINGRTNDANFTFGNLSGVTGLTLSFDTQVHNITSGQNEFINFGLADANIAHSSPGFSFGQAPNSQATWGLGQAAGGSGTSGNLPANIPTNDWIRLSLAMDFTANSGQGSGNLQFTDLTQGGSAVLLTSGFNLGLSPGLSSFWNTMWSRSDFDSNVVFDNLTVTPAVPEVSSTWLVAVACALLVGAHLVRRRRQMRTCSLMP